MKVWTSSVDETRDLGAALAGVLVSGDVVALIGDLGAGKTALAQGVARGLGVKDAVPSPSFVIVREYAGTPPLAHVDVYRLDHLQELHDLGFEEVLDDARVVVIEWADRVEAVLPEDRLDVSLRRGASPNDREIEVVPRGRMQARSAALMAALGSFAGEPC